jgi:hypothetical protein
MQVRDVDAVKLPQVSANIYDRDLAAFGLFGHLICG